MCRRSTVERQVAGELDDENIGQGVGSSGRWGSWPRGAEGPHATTLSAGVLRDWRFGIGRPHAGLEVWAFAGSP
ncbi:hypothetical protein FHS42_004015 [Streptomyces zagrosensis]|uniref:Uncharacterized protein n=1 Tax=Streptomyces zagrosensis TaxID=1042984 RepID=A0A7W9QAZ8_9ACTN|nr:hypothetical protein [Streptomyces zagrosensis]